MNISDGEALGVLPAIQSSSIRSTKSAPSRTLRKALDSKRIPRLVNLKKPQHSAPSTTRKTLPPQNVLHMKGQAASISPIKKRAVVISSQKSCTYNYTVLPGNNSRVVLNAFRIRPWWRSNPKVIPTNHLIWEMFRNRNRYKSKKYRRVILNHIQCNYALVTKSGLYTSLKEYCEEMGINLTSIIPKSFYLAPSRHSNTDREEEMREFIAYSKAVPSETIWIVKPASCSNQGYGIRVVTGLQNCLETIGFQENSENYNFENNESSEDNSTQRNLENGSCEGGDKTQKSRQEELSRHKSKTTDWIVQLYMKNPLLVYGRKFDIRCFVLVVMRQRSNSKGADGDCNLNAYLYKDGYIRTSGKKYSLGNLNDREIHLTNDAVQKKSSSYGKYEPGNKLTYEKFQDAISEGYPHAPPNVVRSKILPNIKYQVELSLKATKQKLMNSFINKSFELFGYDFMVDSNFESFLIEVNSNPCLELSGTVLEDLIPRMVENTFQLAVDELAPPPKKENQSARTRESIDYINSLENRYEEILL